MATIYSEFTTTIANLLADLSTNILSSSDWARPNAAARPNTHKATTILGAEMVVDFGDAAVTSQGMTLGIYRSYDGTNLGDKVTRYLRWKRVSSASPLNTIPLHVRVSAGKDHLYFDVEGPYPGENQPDNAQYGSFRNSFFMCALTPYFDSTIDKAPAVIVGGSIINDAIGDRSNLSHKVAISRDVDNKRSWGLGVMQTLDFPHMQVGDMVTVNRNGPDGNYYLAPWVVFDDIDGIRGRLSSIFSAGPNRTFTYDIAPPPVGIEVMYNGAPYKLIAPNKSDSSNHSWQQWGQSIGNNGDAYVNSMVIAVPAD